MLYGLDEIWKKKLRKSQKYIGINQKTKQKLPYDYLTLLVFFCHMKKENII